MKKNEKMKKYEELTSNEQETTDQYLSELYNGLRNSNKEFDKTVYFSSTILLLISFVLIGNIVDLNRAFYLNHLIIAWCYFMLNLLIKPINHFLSIWAFRKKIFNIENPVTMLNSTIRFLNLFMIFNLSSGTIFLLIFLIKNLT